MLLTSKTDVLSQCYILAIFWKKLVSRSSGQQQEEEEGVEGNTIENRNTNMHRVFVFVFVYFLSVCVYL